MNLAFNELSFRPFAASKEELFKKMGLLYSVFAEAKKRHKFNHVVFPSSYSELMVLEDLNFAQWLSGCKPSLQTEQIRSILKRPFDVEALQDQHKDLDAYFFHEESVGISEEYCIGLGIADLIGTMGLSLTTHEFWEREQLTMRKLSEEKDAEPSDVKVLNVATVKGLESKHITDYIASISKVELIETATLADKKTISLRDDHGKNTLKAFAERIRLSSYVESIVNSLPFNPTAVRFIRKAYANGLLEVVLFWEDKGIGMVIQTTGRNYKETEAIGKILEEKYSK